VVIRKKARRSITHGDGGAVELGRVGRRRGARAVATAAAAAAADAPNAALGVGARVYKGDALVGR
jgi:hypothetical protein